MKLLLALIIAISSINLYADKEQEEWDKKMKKYVEKQLERRKKARLQKEKEWNDPQNKYIRELTKKHYGKTVNGDKERKGLQKEIVSSIKEAE